ncbi:MAG TPA: molybdopterin oxidoreductase family protein [Stellaceae bacterium]|nr:molybdopterin oxidoreductase family protein [Stellaceae bacterium]
MPLDTAPSVCPHDCPSTCALEVERIDSHTIGRVRGARDNSYTSGVVCAKVARYAERQHHPLRLTEPLLRVGEKGAGFPAFKPISWSAALDLIAEKFKAAEARFGSEAIWPYYYAGTMGLVQRDGINRLRHALRYSRMQKTICTALADAGWNAGTGVKRGVDPREIAESDLVVVWGGNPVATQVNVMHHITRARRERGALLVVVDPYRSHTAEVADIHLMPMPGTDGALACAVMHVLLREGYADRDYLARYTAGARELEAHLRTRDPAWAAGITGIPEAQIIDFARLYGRTQRSFIRVGYGFSRSRNGAAQLFAVSCLPAVTGAWRHRGGGALYGNAGIYRFDRTLIEGLDVIDPKTRILDMTRIGPVLTGDKRDIADGPPVTAMLIQNTNPMVVAPESFKVREGFARSDLFVAVHEQFMTETAAMADVVLPATTFLEHDDIYTSGGHTFLQVARKVVEPRGEARANHFVISELARRLGAEHPGFDMTEMQMIEASLKMSGLPPADQFEAGGRWLDCALPFETAHYLDGFGHADKRFHFAADWKSLGRYHEELPALPDHVAIIDSADEAHPFRMMTSPARSFLNTTFNNTPTGIEREARPSVLVHTEDLAALGLAEGDRVRLGNRQGSVVVHAKRFDGLQRGVLVVEGIWPNQSFEEGIGINALTSADPGRPDGGGVFHDTAVWMRAA